MPKRQNIYTYESEEVQGEGSWVKVRALTYGQQKELREMATQVQQLGALVKNGKGDAEQVLATLQDDGAATKLLGTSEQLIVDLIYEWNWVNEDEEPLPLPKDDPAIIDQLTMQEMEFLKAAITGKLGLKK